MKFGSRENLKSVDSNNQENVQPSIEERLKSFDIKNFVENIDKDGLFDGAGDYDNVIESLINLVLKLESKLSQYDTIIGDDASGRLIALFLRQIIKAKRREDGLEPPETLFVAGGRGNNCLRSEKIKELLEKKKDSMGKTLLVTEYISSGDGLQWLAKMMADLGIDFDIATLSLLVKENPTESFQRYPEIVKRLNFGSIGSDGLFFYGKKRIAGVTKQQDDINIVRPENPNITAHATRRPKTEIDVGMMKVARKSLNTLANEINDKLLSNK